MQEPGLKDLLDKFLRGEASPEEQKELFQIVRTPAQDVYVKEILRENWLSYTATEKMPESSADLMFRSILKEAEGLHTPAAPVVKFGSWRRMAVAAALLFGMAGSYFFFIRKPHTETVKTENPKIKEDVLPGGNRAILTLGNGTRIILDSAVRGTLALQGNTKIIHINNGLVYRVSGSHGQAAAETAYNVLSTPRGGQYQLTLPDGTKVWLNAASSIRYPTAFNDRERKVTVTGEAYFEVAHQAQRPFVVMAGGQRTEDIGTAFNVNAYGDEAPVVTTLVEGSVRVQNLILKPGQQSRLLADGELKRMDHPDVEAAVAWKNGLFNFNRASLEVVMQQIARWYDVDVEYEKNIPAIRFYGEMQRSLNLSDVLEILGKMDVHFQIEGRRLIVKP